MQRIGIHRTFNPHGKDWLLDRAINIDDDVAEALYSANRLVPIYDKSQVTSLKNNDNGATPGPDYIPGWKLTLSGLQFGLAVSLDLRSLFNRFELHEEITRFVCVECWCEIAWWGGFRFADLLQAFPPVSQAKWARIESSISLDVNGNADPYYVSLDIETAQHLQSLLATHFHGDPLTLERGAPLRLIVPVKLGLKNVKAIPYLARRCEDTAVVADLGERLQVAVVHFRCKAGRPYLVKTDVLGKLQRESIRADSAMEGHEHLALLGIADALHVTKQARSLRQEKSLMVMGVQVGAQRDHNGGG